jgi:CubicO group peptidase (beta-lactamase class C family)
VKLVSYCKVIAIVASLLIVVVVTVKFTGNQHLLTAVVRTYLNGEVTANINDHSVFHTRVIKAGVAQPWPLHPEYSDQNLPTELTEYMAANHGAAFAVVHQGKLLAEHYLPGYGPDSKTNSFSMAKTVVTLLLGIAIEEGYIDGMDQPLTDFLPEFSKDEFGRQASVGSLSSMTSGYDWDEHYYSPLSPTVKLVYGDDVEQFVLGRSFTKAPETHWYYSSASTQLLVVVITRALQAKNPEASLAEYLSQKLWLPLGMNADGLWHLDNSGMELGFCCINTSARNFAKLGQLMLQDGEWVGQQLVPSQFIEKMRNPVAKPFYGYSTWIYNDSSQSYYAFRGHLGQYIIVVPDHDLVVVRLGESRNQNQDLTTDILPFYIEQALQVVAGN